MKIIDNILVPDWAERFKLGCGFTLPFYGNQALTRPSKSGSLILNRKLLAKHAGFDALRIFAPHQVHGSNVLTADKSNLGHGAFGLENADDGDGCITRQDGITLITTWADCIPIILYDDETHTAAAVHSGWRGTAKNVVAATVAAMHSNPADIYASVGPGIRGCCYEVGTEVADVFKHMSFAIAECVAVRDGRFYLDLQSIVYTQLLECGIPQTQIDRSTLCTCCSKEPEFFSCRKDGKETFEGQAAFIVRR